MDETDPVRRAVPAWLVLPHSREAERDVLRFVDEDDGAFDEASKVLEPDDFFDPENARRFAEAAARRDRPERWRRLARHPPASGSVRVAARVVKEKADLRRVIEAAVAVVEEALAEPTSVSDFATRSEARIANALARLSPMTPGPVVDCIAEIVTEIQKSAEARPSHIVVRTELGRGEGPTRTLPRGTLTSIRQAGATARRATLHAMAASARRPDDDRSRVPALLVSPRMPARAVVEGMLAAMVGIPVERLLQEQFDRETWPELAMACADLDARGLYIDEAARDLAGVSHLARRARAEHAIELLLLDDLPQLLGDPHPSEADVLDAFVRLRHLARALDVAVVVSLAPPNPEEEE